MANEKLQAVRGMNDILPDTSAAWSFLEQTLVKWAESYGFRNIRTPILEQTRLFKRGIGEVTDIVEKEMYTFTMNPEPKEDDWLTMRPEFTAGIVRAVVQHNLLYGQPQRLYSMGQAFRHERPQKGRYRQFHQMSVEAMGFEGPDVDAELIIMLNRLWKMLDLKDISLEINSLGVAEERLKHREALIKHLEAHVDILDEDAKRRMYTNPLRVLDTKNPALQEMANSAPRLSDFLGEASQAHFEGLQERLQMAGIPYTINPRLVRGLDYYNHSVFEWVTGSLGAQATVAGGGRYDGLIELLGGKPTPAVGFGLGIDRLFEISQLQHRVFTECDVYLIHSGQAGSLEAQKLGEQCRDHGLRTIVHAGSGSFKAQFKRADASGALLALILGDNEVQKGEVTLKMLHDAPETAPKAAELPQGTQLTISQEQLFSYLRDALAW